MDQQEFEARAAHFAAGDRVDHAGDDGCLECFQNGEALVDEVRRLRAGLQYIVDRVNDEPCLCWIAADDVLDGKPLPV